MESSGGKQRSPWFYVLVGCGVTALLMCLGGAFLVGSCGYMGKQMAAGATDPEEKKKNAVAQLGAVPPGYNVVMAIGLPFGVGKMSILTDQPVDADGGFTLTSGRAFMYRTQMMQAQQLAAVKDLFAGKPSADPMLAQVGLVFDEASVLKRTELTVDGRKLLVVVTKGRVAAQSQVAGLNSHLFFVCPDDKFRLGTWSQSEPPTDGQGAPNLAGTVADEAELAKFVKSINPCGK